MQAQQIFSSLQNLLAFGSPKVTSRYEHFLQRLRTTFQGARNKHEAHERCRPLLEEISHDPSFLTETLRRYMQRHEIWSVGHYPVLALPIEANEHFELVVNCWIPTPERRDDLATKPIHHHGSMLLSTVTIFGPGYEHWLFEKPTLVDATRELYALKLIAREAHPMGHWAFVDRELAHLPLYPSSLSLTLALWSSSRASGWRDKVKRIPLVQRYNLQLRDVALRLGLAKPLAMNVIEYFDFYPVAEGFRGMRDRIEFAFGPNADFLQSLCFVLQQTQNEALVPLVRAALPLVPRENREFAALLCQKLAGHEPIEGKLSKCHLNVPHASFVRADIERSLLQSEAYVR